MVVPIVLTILLVITLLAASLRSVYGAVPVKELKRRANKGDQFARIIHEVSRHGLTGDFFLLSISIVGSAFIVVLLADSLPIFTAAVLASLLIVLVIHVLPKHAPKPFRKVAFKVSPYLAKFLVKIRPATNFFARIFRKYRPITIHTGLYDKEDLIDLLQTQKVVATNRIETTELDIAAHALVFGEKKVLDYMVPNRTVHFVKTDDSIGPILLNELHESGFSRFPVRDEEDKIVGTLYLRDLVEKQRTFGIVGNVMNKSVYYVNASAPLEHVFRAFMSTKHHLFIVVNEFEEVVGIITIEDVIEQVLGRKIVDEFDRYDDMRAVAAGEAEIDKRERQDQHI